MAEDRLYDGPFMDALKPETRSMPGASVAGRARMFVEDGGEDGVRNALGAELRSRRARAKNERIPFLEWALKVPEPKTGTLDFDRFPFQRELYGPETAAAKEAVIMKATQVGVSAWLSRWALYWADMRGLNALYVFPKLKQMYDFSDARIRASILKSPFLSERIPPRSVGNKGLKQVGGGWTYWRGSESEDDLDSVDADVLALDEYDRLTKENIPVAERRISGSQLGLLRRVGVPTIPGYGISRLYEASDRRRWLVTCRCGTEQRMTWTDNVDEERRLRICRACSRELRPEDVAAGRWAAEESDREVRGYHITKLIQPDADVRALVERSRRGLPEERQAFWNRDMAEPYAPAEGRLSPQAIAAASSAGERAGVTLVEGYDGEGLVTMGVDVASTRNLYVRVSLHRSDGRKQALWIGEAEEFEDLDRIMDRYRVHMAVVDHLPEGRLARAFAERFPGRVYLVRYAQSTTQRVLIVDEAARMLSVRRLEAVDATFELVRGQRNLLPPELPERYAEHLMAMIRVADQDELGRKKVRYESTGRDDYAHAEVYDLVATEAWRYRQAVEAETRETFTLLDEHLEWDRSALHDQDDATYAAGPADVYVAGGSGEE